MLMEFTYKDKSCMKRIVCVFSPRTGYATVVLVL